MASKSHGWDAKNKPKLAQNWSKTAILRLQNEKDLTYRTYGSGLFEIELAQKTAWH